MKESESSFAKISNEKDKMQKNIDDMQSNEEENLSTIAQLKDDIDGKTLELEEMKKSSQNTKSELDSVSNAMNEILEKNILLMTESSNNKETIISLQQQIKRLESRVVEQSSGGTDSNVLLQSTTHLADRSSPETVETAGSEKNDNRYSTQTSIENYSSEIMSSELESLRNKCLKLQNELSTFKNGRQSMISSVKHSSTSAKADMGSLETDSKRKQRKKKRVTSENIGESLKYGNPTFSSSFAESSSSECDDHRSSRSVSSNNESMHEGSEQNMTELFLENQTLKQKIEELEQVLQERRQKNSFEPVPWLQLENKRLLDLLKQAEKEVEDSQVQKRVAFIKNRIHLIDRYINFFNEIHRTLDFLLFQKFKY